MIIYDFKQKTSIKVNLTNIKLNTYADILLVNPIYDFVFFKTLNEYQLYDHNLKEIIYTEHINDD